MPQLIADFGSALRRAFADNNAHSFSNEIATERQANLAAALNGNYFALNRLAHPMRSGLRGVRVQVCAHV